MSDTIQALLSWAVMLSHYPAPAEPPQVIFKPHEFFVEKACMGHPCKAMGWYNDDGVVYLDQQVSEADSAESRSIWVHEFVHYLQHRSGKYQSGECHDRVEREREAYAVQYRFMTHAHGLAAFRPIRFKDCS
jgi:hypothetical protein